MWQNHIKTANLLQFLPNTIKVSVWLWQVQWKSMNSLHFNQSWNLSCQLLSQINWYQHHYGHRDQLLSSFFTIYNSGWVFEIVKICKVSLPSGMKTATCQASLALIECQSVGKVCTLQKKSLEILMSYWTIILNKPIISLQPFHAQMTAFLAECGISITTSVADVLTYNKIPLLIKTNFLRFALRMESHYESLKIYESVDSPF